MAPSTAIATAPGAPVPAADPSLSGAGGPQQHLLALLAGKMISATLCTLARVGIADHFDGGAKSVEALAEATDTDAPMLYRFLRTASSVGVFHEDEDGRFSLTETGDLLRSDAPGSIRYLAYMYGEESVWNCFSGATDTLRTGLPAGPAFRGGDGWFEYMERSGAANDGEYAEVFHKAMTGVSSRAPEVAKSYDFGRFALVADIGGGQGKLLSAILESNPGQRGLLFDTASAVAGAAPVLAATTVADRVDTVVGDFFEAVPSGPDAYVLKAILHDWNDEDSLRILRSIRTAVGENADACVFIVEAVVSPRNEWHFSKAMDIAMGVSLGGKERSEDEWRMLLAEGGFELVGTTRTAPPHWIIEARPIAS